MRRICRRCENLVLPLKGNCVLCQWITTRYPTMYVGDENLTLKQRIKGKKIDSFPYTENLEE